MADKDGKPDTQEIYEHGQSIKAQGVAIAQAAHDMQTFGGELTAANKTARLTAFRSLHPGCTACLASELNPPAPVPAPEG